MNSQITTVGVDLAKNVIQVCKVEDNQVLFNRSMKPAQFAQWLCTEKPCRVVFESCSTSNYWKQLATSYGHDAKLISAQLVESVRQHQKNDRNDALAIVQAAQLPAVCFIAGKTIEQQQLQSTLRLRELAVKQKTALSNQLKAILLEFNIRTGGKISLKVAIQSTLEDGENELSHLFRMALDHAWKQYLQIVNVIQIYDDGLNQFVSTNPQCKKFMRLEGVGIINAINLYLAFYASDEEECRSARSAAARFGLTPIQHSSGGKSSIGSIGRHVKNTIVRSQLITGAFTYVNHLEKRDPKTEKDAWIKEMIKRRGKKCTAVALANKTVRTAYAMVANQTNYQSVALTV